MPTVMSAMITKLTTDQAIMHLAFRPKDFVLREDRLLGANVVYVLTFLVKASLSTLPLWVSSAVFMISLATY